MNVNVNLIEENVIQIESEIILNVDASVKKTLYTWKRLYSEPY